MRHLRFGPDEHRLLAGFWHRLDLGGRPRTASKRPFAQALSGLFPDLAGRINGQGEAELGLLCDHFLERAPSTDEQWFTPEELQLVTQACLSTPFPVRLARRFQSAFVELLRQASPELSRKVARLSGYQFKRLCKQARGQSRG